MRMTTTSAILIMIQVLTDDALLLPGGVVEVVGIGLLTTISVPK